MGHAVRLGAGGKAATAGVQGGTRARAHGCKGLLEARAGRGDVNREDAKRLLVAGPVAQSETGSEARGARPRSEVAEAEWRVARQARSALQQPHDDLPNRGDACHVQLARIQPCKAGKGVLLDSPALCLLRLERARPRVQPRRVVP